MYAGVAEETTWVSHVTRLSALVHRVGDAAVFSRWSTAGAAVPSVIMSDVAGATG
jgi:hypothetical protein